MILSLKEIEAAPYLQKIGTSIDSYGRAVSPQADCAEWIQVRAPAEALASLNFARNAVSLLPRSEWALLLFNHASYLDPIDRFQFSRLIFGNAATLATPPPQALLFNHPENTDLLVLSDIINLSLLHNINAQLVTSEHRNGECISIEDGFLYINVDRSRSTEIGEALAKLEGKKPMTLPSWLSKINGDFQFTECFFEERPRSGVAINAQSNTTSQTRRHPSPRKDRGQSGKTAKKSGSRKPGEKPGTE